MEKWHIYYAIYDNSITIGNETFFFHNQLLKRFSNIRIRETLCLLHFSFYCILGVQFFFTSADMIYVLCKKAFARRESYGK